jgi:HSF-type DNA-binding
MKVLSCKEYESIICWTPSGKAFTIEKPKLFASEILPQHFKTAKYSSFTRKLHRWGFMRHYRGSETGSFFHKNFMKGRLDLIEKVTCYMKDDGASNHANTMLVPDGVSTNSNVDNKISKRECNTTLPVQKERSDEAFYRSLAASMSSSVKPRSVVHIPVPRRISLPVSSLSSADSLLVREKLLQEFENCTADLQSRIHATATSQQQLPSTSIGITSAESAAVAASNLTGQLNAAIEAEVARRLNERLTQVVMTKRALELMQRPSAQSLQMPSRMSQLLGQGLLGWNRSSDVHTQALQLQQHLRNREALLSVHQGMSDIDSLVNSLPLAALQRELSISNNNSYSDYKSSPIDYTAASVDSYNNMPTLPPTNIQGAKTA